MSRRSTFNLVFSLFLLSLVLISRTSHAVITDVWYNPTLAAAPAVNQDAQVERIIMQALREIEAHSFGAVHFNYRGVSTSPPCGNGGNRIAIMWSQAIPGCGKTNLNATCGLGDISLNPTFVTSLTPALDSRCADLRATIVHELTHWFRFDLFNFHPLNSVLTLASSNGDLASRHLWTFDMDSINNVYNPRGPTFLSQEFYSSATNTVWNAGGTLFASGSNFTGALAPGTNGNMYSRVHSASNGTMIFQQGDGFGAGWSAPQTIWPTGTVQRSCIATRTTDNDMFVAWTDVNQTAFQFPEDPNRFVGTRLIKMLASSDGGVSWTSDGWGGTLLFAATRSGISCAYDRLHDRIVLVYSDEEERLRVSSRPASGLAGSNHWSIPALLPDAFGNAIWSSDGPLVSFDPFALDDYGLVTWWDGAANDQRMQLVHFSAGAGQYIANSGFLSPWTDPVEASVLRTAVVPNLIEGARHWAFATQGTGFESRYRRRTPFFENNDIINNIPSSNTAVFDWYTGSAANTLLVETSYLRQGYQQ